MVKDDTEVVEAVEAVDMEAVAAAVAKAVALIYCAGIRGDVKKNPPLKPDFSPPFLICMFLKPHCSETDVFSESVCAIFVEYFAKSFFSDKIFVKQILQLFSFDKFEFFPEKLQEKKNKNDHRS